jgi:hypothetical protein
MKPSRVLPAVAALALSLSASGQALGGGHRPPPKFPRIFDAADASPRTLAAIERVVRQCSFSEMERAGPSPAEEQRCESAEKQLVAMGKAAVRPVLASLDREDLVPGARAHLYDTVTRIGDPGAVAIFITALDRLAAPEGEERRWETEYVEVALQQLTFARLGQPLPWEGQEAREPAVAARDWKRWLASHSGLDVEQLLTERLDADRPHLNDEDTWHALWYASFFAEHAASREEGIAALKALLERKDLESEEKASIRGKLREAKRELGRDKIKAAKARKTGKAATKTAPAVHPVPKMSAKTPNV